MKQKVFLGPT